MLGARHWILDRFQGRFENARDAKSGASLFHIRLDLNWLEDRIVYLRAHRPIDLQHNRAGLSAFPLHDCRQRPTLVFVGAFVDDRLKLAVAFVDGTWPSKYSRRINHPGARRPNALRRSSRQPLRGNRRAWEVR